MAHDEGSVSTKIGFRFYIFMLGDRQGLSRKLRRIAVESRLASNPVVMTC